MSKEITYGSLYFGQCRHIHCDHNTCFDSSLDHCKSYKGQKERQLLLRLRLFKLRYGGCLSQASKKTVISVYNFYSLKDCPDLVSGQFLRLIGTLLSTMLRMDAHSRVRKMLLTQPRSARAYCKQYAFLKFSLLLAIVAMTRHVFGEYSN